MASMHIIELDDGSFEEKVLKADGLVLVDFWATWCGPCLALGPTLESLAEEYAGRAVFGKLNVDAGRATAGAWRVTSIPTVLFFKGGKLVGSLVGVRPKQAYRDLIDSHL